MSFHVPIMFLLCFFSTQDEEQDPLLNSFGHLKDVLNNIKGMWGCVDVGWVQGDGISTSLKCGPSCLTVTAFTPA